MELFIATKANPESLEQYLVDNEEATCLLVNDGVFLHEMHDLCKVSERDCVERGVGVEDGLTDEKIIELIFEAKTITVI